MSDFKRYLSTAIPANEVLFWSNPEKVLFSGKEVGLRNFARAIASKTYTLEIGSEDWKELAKNLQRVTQMSVFEATVGDIASNPAQILVNCILDFDKILTSGQLPGPDTPSPDIFFIKHFAAKENAEGILEAFSKEY